MKESTLEEKQILQEFCESNLSLARFARHKGIPYMRLKRLVQKYGSIADLKNKPTEERQVILGEYYASGMAEEDFADSRGINQNVFRQWLSEQDRLEVKEGKDQRLSERGKKYLAKEYLNSDLSPTAFAKLKGFSHVTLYSYLNKYYPETIKKPPLTEEEKESLAKEFIKSDMTKKDFISLKGVSDSALSQCMNKYYPEYIKRVSLLSDDEKQRLVKEYLHSDMTHESFLRLKELVKVAC